MSRRDDEILASIGQVTPEAVRSRIIIEELRGLRGDFQRMSMLIESLPCVCAKETNGRPLVKAGSPVLRDPDATTCQDKENHDGR